MRRFHLGLAMVALPVFALALFLAGCSKEEKKDTASSSTNGDNDPTKSTGERKALAASKGHVKGEIRLKGSPDLDKRTKELLAQIDTKKDDKDKCLAGDESEKTQQTYRVGANKLVGNVFVWLMPGSDSYFKIDDKQVEEAKNHPLKLHQPHCAFIPHCAVLFTKYKPSPTAEPKPTGQFVEVKNDAEMAHNTSWKGGAKNSGGNELIGVGKGITIKNLVPEATPVRISCTIHTWMDGYLRVFDHPYATVSLSDTLDGANKVKPDDPKFGTFEMKNLPVGNMRIVAWHESAGYLNKDGGKGQPITIKDGEPTPVDFELTAK